VVWVWTGLFTAIAVFGALVTWRSLMMVWRSLQALAVEVESSVDRLADAAGVLDGLGDTAPFTRQPSPRAILEAADRARHDPPPGRRTFTAALPLPPAPAGAQGQA
jgi:hypothetical protein